MILKNDPIAKLVQDLDPIDWVQMRLLSNLPPEKRIIPALQAQAFSMAALRGTFQKRYPEISLSELNMKVLAYFTPVRIYLK